MTGARQVLPLLLAGLATLGGGGARARAAPEDRRVITPEGAQRLGAALKRLPPPWRLDAARVEPHEASARICRDAGGCASAVLSAPDLPCAGSRAGAFCLSIDPPDPSLAAALVAALAPLGPDSVWRAAAPPSPTATAPPPGPLPAWRRTPAVAWDHLEAPLWILLAPALFGLLRRAAARARAEGVARLLLIILAGALAARLLSRAGPPCWYFPMQDGLLPGLDVFHRRSTFVTLPYRLLLAWPAAAAHGLVLLNIALGTVGIVPYWLAARLGGRDRRAALTYAALFAAVPLFVRFSASDAGLFMAFFLFGVAAAAYAELAEGSGGAGARLALVAAVALLVPVRTETAVLVPALVLFRDRGHGGARALLPARAAAPLALGLGIGTLKLLTQADAALPYVRFQPLGFTAMIASRLLFVPSMSEPALVPWILAIPTWLLVARRLRERAWPELRVLYLPVLLTGLPFCFGVATMGHAILYDLAAAGYHLVPLAFVLLGLAEGLVYGAEVAARRDLLATPTRRWGATLVAAALAAHFFVWPLRHTWSYQEEHAFLSRALPARRARVLAIFDQDTHTNDLDCCLALPYPTLFASRPDLEWVVLGRRDLDPARIAALSFDYYYPGTMIQAEITDAGPTPFGMDPQVVALERIHVAELRALDALVRRAHPLALEARARAPGRTWTHVRFPGDRLDLVLYRRDAR